MPSPINMRKDHIPALQRELANSAKTVPARHRDTHDLFAEVFDPRFETTILRDVLHPDGLVNRAGAHPTAPAVDQPIFPRSSKASRKPRK